MATAARSPGVTLRGRFEPGTEVKLYVRRGDVFNGPVGAAVARAKTSRQSETSFSGLVDGERYWAVSDDESRAVSVTAKLQAAAKVREERPDPVSARPHQRTEVVPPRGGDVEVPDGVERLPQANQADVSGVLQRSDTAAGAAVPKPEGESVPGLRQDQVPKGTLQRSDTEIGEATIIPKGEVGQSPGMRQEDAPANMLQRAVGATGTAFPKPAGGSSAAQELVKVLDAKNDVGESLVDASKVKPTRKRQTKTSAQAAAIGKTGAKKATARPKGRSGKKAQTAKPTVPAARNAAPKPKRRTTTGARSTGNVR